MHKVLRFTALAILAASGLTACGDKVTNVTNTTTSSTTTSNPTLVVRSVTVTPNAVSLNAGQTVQLVATVDADAGVARTVTWSSSATAVATVDNTGKVTAVAAGTAVIIATSTADAGKQGTAAITVAGTTNPSVTIAAINKGGAPANLTGVTGQLDVTLNVDPGSTFIKTINLFLNCGAGDVLVASQTVSDKAPMTGPAGATQPVTLSFNTADTTSAGVPKFKNGQCTVKGQLITTTGSTFNSANSVQITLANLSTYTATITSVNSHGGSWPQSAISTADGLQRVQGNVTLTIKALNYSTGVGLQTITVNFMGITTSASASAGQTFVISYPADSSKTTAFGCTSACTGIYQYASAAGGEPAPNITSSIDSTGNNGFTAAATLPAPFRVDNKAPATPVSAVVNTNAGSNNWINASYTLSGTGKYKSGGDAEMGTVTDSIGYASPTGYTALVGGTAVGDAFCSKSAFTIVSSMSAIPTSTVNNAYRARVFEYDLLGNVRCTDLTVSVAGVASGNTFGVDKISPTIAFSSANSGVSAKKKILAANGAGNNFTMAYVDTGSGFNPSLPVAAMVQYNYGSDSASCSVGWNNTKQACTEIPMAGSFQVDAVQAAPTGGTVASCGAAGVSCTGFTPAQGYYTITVHSVDQAGNTSPDSTRSVLIDNTSPTLGTVSQSPSAIASLGTGTFTAAAKDNVDLASWSGTLNYAPASGAVAFAETGGTFNAGFNGTLVQSGTATVTITSIFRGMQGTVGGAISADAAAPSMTISDKDVAGNPAATSTLAIAMGTTDTPHNILQSCGTGACGFNVGTNLGTKSLSEGAGGSSTVSSMNIVANVTGTTTGVPNQPFTTVYFYYLSGTKLVLIGSQSLAAVTDDGSGNRTWSFTLSGVTAAQLGSPDASGGPVTVNVYAVGVNAAGDAAITNTNPATPTVVQ